MEWLVKLGDRAFVRRDFTLQHWRNIGTDKINKEELIGGRLVSNRRNLKEIRFVRGKICWRQCHQEPSKIRKRPKYIVNNKRYIQ